MEIDSEGFIYAQTWSRAATRARFESDVGDPIDLQVLSGEPTSLSRWVVFTADIPTDNPGALRFRIVFLDAAGNQVDVVSN